jgi:hypothetical protein
VTIRTGTASRLYATGRKATRTRKGSRAAHRGVTVTVVLRRIDSPLNGRFPFRFDAAMAGPQHDRDGNREPPSRDRLELEGAIAGSRLLMLKAVVRRYARDPDRGRLRRAG